MASWEQRMKMAAAQAALEATTRERARCLGILESIVWQLEDDIKETVVITTGDLHVMETKAKIARAVVAKARQLIMLRPMGRSDIGQGGQGGVVGSREGADGAVFPPSQPPPEGTQ